ncbi:MAG: excinuclease ABC subunit C [Bradymonadia bacterium]|jgi:excinuclease ABC subunit C
MSVPEHLKETVSSLPQSPGVYIMRGHGKEIIYIGKATNLRSRVRSYFSGNDPRAFVQYLDRLLAEVEFVLCANPKEALLLENTLIKRHKPRFNFMLRDDKNYLAIRIDPRKEWPRVELVRKIKKDGAHYFGPYHSAAKVRQTLNILNRYFQLRTCNDSVLRNRTRPCLQYQIRRCPGPCAVGVDRDAYLDHVHNAEMFLSGKETELLSNLEGRMLGASERLEFEEAARFRDQASAVRASLERQGAVQTTQVDRDVVGFYREADDVALVVMAFRLGSLNDIRSFALTDQVVPDGQTIASFIAQYYAAAGRIPPKELLLPTALPVEDQTESALAEMRGSKCAILVPQRGEKLRLVELANENAQAFFGESMSTSAQAEKALQRVAKRLRLDGLPRTIECYDISNFQGAHIVGSRVVFQDAVPDRARYRKIRIRSVVGQDDFASMNEVIARRVASSRKNDDPMPDLIVLDGGKGQLNAALAALASFGLESQPVAALAKSRIVGTDASDVAVRSSERVFLPGQKNPVILPEHTPECLLLARIRDEAHRHAIEYHRYLRRKRTLRSTLEDVPGIGAGRRNQLLTHFGSAKAVAAATLPELEGVSGLSRMLAFAVFEHFHPGEADPPA